MSPILFLTAAEVLELLTLEETIGAVERAFRVHGERKVPAPGVLGMHVAQGGFHIKAGVLHLSRPYFAAKVNGNFPGNPGRFGLPTIQGIIVLCDADNGRVLALMDSIALTALRTAAATAVAAKYLARPSARTVTILGCGTQGRVQLKALALMRRLEKAFAYDISGEQSARFARDLTADLGIPVVVAKSFQEAVLASDICVTCTPSHDPLLASVAEGTFIAAIGADNPQKQELDPQLMKNSKVVVDALEQCAAMGDLHHAILAGIMSESDVYAELGEVVAGRKPGREREDEVIIFDSTGMALQDVAAAALVYEKAAGSGRGLSLRLSTPTEYA